MIKQRTKL